MSVSTSTDAVTTVIDILEATELADWTNPGGKPERIARSGDYTPREKNAYEQSDALYLSPSGEDTFSTFSADNDRYEQTAMVAVDCRTLGGRDRARQIARNVRHIVRAYSFDNSTDTTWTTIRPVSGSSDTSSAFTGKLHNQAVVTIRLSSLRKSV